MGTRTPNIEVEFRNMAFTAMRDQARATRRRLMQPTQTWDEPVDCYIEGPQVDHGHLVCRVIIDDDRYYWLNYGTKVRYATMTNNFVPKTRVHDFNPGMGRGGVKFVSRAYPKPGIEAREWVELEAQGRGGGGGGPQPPGGGGGAPGAVRVVAESLVTLLLKKLQNAMPWNRGRR